MVSLGFYFTTLSRFSFYFVATASQLPSLAPSLLPIDVGVLGPRVGSLTPVASKTLFADSQTCA